MFGKKKKYPWNRTEDEEQNSNRPVPVYAGPEYYANMPKPADMEDVYAAPENLSENPEPVITECVYASPEAFRSLHKRRKKPSENIPANYCKNCGRRVPFDQKFCACCGAEVKE